MTEASQAALEALRSPDHFEWYWVNLLAMVIYVYSVEVRAKRWDAVVLGLAFWFAELLWEMFNALVLYWSGTSALWTVGGKSVFLILVGLNVEIYFMFAIVPIVLFNLLPEDRKQKILGLPNRILIPSAVGVFCVAMETILNRWDALIWHWSFWRWPNIALIVLAYAGPLVLLAWAYDHWSLRTKVRVMVFMLVALAAGWWLFVEHLHWI